jgi:hypothetical protein
VLPFARVLIAYNEAVEKPNYIESVYEGNK